MGKTIIIKLLSKISNFSWKGGLLSLSLIPKCRPDKIKNNMKNKSGNINQKLKNKIGIEI